MIYQARELDIIFMSFDEPNADQHFQHLLSIVPWARRSHGVLGFDAAHKAAAAMATTDLFITVDGDSEVLPILLDVALETNRHDDFAVATNAQNSVNGLCYGNGGLKFWTKGFVNNMKSHEAAVGSKLGLDFCWSDNYISTRDTVFCTTHPNSSPFHAWRAGFREGLKMADTYLRLGIEAWASSDLFLTWCSVGADQPHGAIVMDAAIHGAHSRLYGTVASTVISDYTGLGDLWLEFNSLGTRLQDYRKSIASIYNLPDLPVLSPVQSMWFKAALPKRNICTVIPV